MRNWLGYQSIHVFWGYELLQKTVLRAPLKTAPVSWKSFRSAGKSLAVNTPSSWERSWSFSWSRDLGLHETVSREQIPKKKKRIMGRTLKLRFVKRKFDKFFAKFLNQCWIKGTVPLTFVKQIFFNETAHAAVTPIPYFFYNLPRFSILLVAHWFFQTNGCY